MPGHELLGEEEKQALIDLFNQGAVLYRYGLNDRRKNIFRVDEFEKAMASRVGSKHALCVCNGTAALKLALMSVGVSPGDEVITQSFTFIATVEAILELGARPVITEIDESLNMDPEDLRRCFSSRTKAIVPVHMAGVSARMDEILAIAQEKNVPVVEDSAQALGGTYHGKSLGTLGRAGIYSLDIGKVITTGEGGFVVSNDDHVFRRSLEYSDHGHEQNPHVPRGEDTRTYWGFNYKATEMQGAVGLAQLKKMDEILSKQKQNKRAIKERLQDIPLLQFRSLPDPVGDTGDTLIFFLPERDQAKALARKLAERGFGTKNLPDAVNWHFAGTWDHIFKEEKRLFQGNLEARWPRSADLLRRAIALPIMVKMGLDRCDALVDAIHDISRTL